MRLALVAAVLVSACAPPAAPLPATAAPTAAPIAASPTSPPPAVAPSPTSAVRAAASLAIPLEDVRTRERFTLGQFAGKVTIVQGMAVW